MATYELTLPFSADFKLYKNDAKYFTDVTLESYFANYTGATHYVSNTGSDTTGEGTSGNPYATVDAAIAAASDLDIISISPGDYAHPSSPITKNLAFVRNGSSGLVLFGSFYDLSGVTINSNTVNGHTYYTTNESITGGYIEGFLRVDTLTGTQGGVYGASSSVNFTSCQDIHSDGYLACYTSSASGNTSYFLGDNSLDFPALVAAGSIRAWKGDNTGSFTFADNVSGFIGDDIVVTSELTALESDATTGALVVLGGCHFYSPDNSTVKISGETQSRMFGTVVCGSVNNNIDYDGTSTATCLEVDVISVNGKENCSTAHSSTPIVRIGGTYFNSDRPIADTVSTYSLNLSLRVGSGNFDTDSKLIRSVGDVKLHYGDVEFFGQYSTQIDDTGTVTPVEEPLAGAWSFGQTLLAPPTANAGPDLNATDGETVALSGATASNYDTLQWTCTSGQSPTFSDATVLNPTVTFNEPGVHVLQLEATNTEGSSSDTVEYTVAAGGVTPTANAGPNQSVAAGVKVQLNGLNSTPGVSFNWYQVSGSPVNLRNSNTATPSFTSPAVSDAGDVVIGLTVELDGLVSTESTVTISYAAFTGPAKNPNSLQSNINKKLIK